MHFTSATILLFIIFVLEKQYFTFTVAINKMRTYNTTMFANILHMRGRKSRQKLYPLTVPLLCKRTQRPNRCSLPTTLILDLSTRGRQCNPKLYISTVGAPNFSRLSVDSWKIIHLKMPNAVFDKTLRSTTCYLRSWNPNANSHTTIIYIWLLTKGDWLHPRYFN